MTGSVPSSLLNLLLYPAPFPAVSYVLHHQTPGHSQIRILQVLCHPMCCHLISQLPCLPIFPLPHQDFVLLPMLSFQTASSQPMVYFLILISPLALLEGAHHPPWADVGLGGGQGCTVVLCTTLVTFSTVQALHPALRSLFQPQSFQRMETTLSDQKSILTIQFPVPHPPPPTCRLSFLVGLSDSY